MSDADPPPQPGLGRREFYGHLGTVYFVMLVVYRGPGPSASWWGNAAFGIVLFGLAASFFALSFRSGRA